VSWLDRLKASTAFQAERVETAPTKPTKPPSVGFVGSLLARPSPNQGPTPELMDALGDTRPCTWCRRMASSGRCLAAARGELRAARDYEPTDPAQARRCIAYQPLSIDPDQRPGRERWPELVDWQAPIGADNG
jgi:hypothetical protein